jgi:DNA adenine methylase
MAKEDGSAMFNETQNYFYHSPVRPILKTGDLFSGISYLRRHYPGVFPDCMTKYVEPFLGNGSMYFNISCDQKHVNDYSLELIGFYELVRDRNREFFNYLNNMCEMWDFLETLADEQSVRLYNSGDDDGLMARLEYHEDNIAEFNFTRDREEYLIPGLQITLVSRVRRFRRAEYEDGEMDDHERAVHLESAFKAGLYEHIRAIYNDSKEITTQKIACWYFLRRYCFNGIFRQNSNKHFTSPFGGVKVNPISPDGEIEQWYESNLTYHLNHTLFESANFTDFLEEEHLDRDDFVFVDPPQTPRSSSFTEYNFTYSDHVRLADFLIHRCPAQWMLLLKPNPKIERLYRRKRTNTGLVHINHFTKNFEERHHHRSDQTKMLLLKNY